jgi:hypothetical protein
VSAFPLIVLSELVILLNTHFLKPLATVNISQKLIKERPQEFEGRLTEIKGTDVYKEIRKKRWLKYSVS